MKEQEGTQEEPPSLKRKKTKEPIVEAEDTEAPTIKRRKTQEKEKTQPAKKTSKKKGEKSEKEETKKEDKEPEPEVTSADIQGLFKTIISVLDKYKTQLGGYLQTALRS